MRARRLRPRLLFYAMYDPTIPDRAPHVRIRLLEAALRRRADVTMISGERLGRARRGLAWLAGRGLRDVDAVYVEASTSFSTPADLAILGLIRLLGKPVGVYFRDAYQLFRDDFPVHGLKAHALDLLWRISNPMLRSVATIHFVQSSAMGDVLGLRRAVLLPPGTDPDSPFLASGDEPLVAAVISPTTAGGFELLLDAMAVVRSNHPDHRLRLITALDDSTRSRLPDWVEAVPGSRADLPLLLEPAQLVVIPLPAIRYMHMVLPVRLMDYLALGKPIVSTDLGETRRTLGDTGALLLVDATADGLAAGIAQVLDDPSLRAGLAARARAVAESDAWTWDARAATILSALLPDWNPSAVGVIDEREAGTDARA